MKAVVQRVKSATVQVEGKTVGHIGPGLLIYLGIENGDLEETAQLLTKKIVSLRTFANDHGKMAISLEDLEQQHQKPEVLVVSQFTLLADLNKGRRPSFHRAAAPALAETLYDFFIDALRELGIHVQSGVFAAMMQVYSQVDGPVTYIMDTERSV